MLRSETAQFNPSRSSVTFASLRFTRFRSPQRILVAASMKASFPSWHRASALGHIGPADRLRAGPRPIRGRRGVRQFRAARLA